MTQRNREKSQNSVHITALKEAAANGGPVKIQIDPNAVSPAGFAEALGPFGQLYLEPLPHQRTKPVTIDTYPMEHRAASGQLTYIELPVDNPWNSSRFWGRRR